MSGVGAGRLLHPCRGVVLIQRALSVRLEQEMGRRGKSKEWLQDVAWVQIPDSDSLQADACGPGYKYDSHTRLQLESKDAMERPRG